MVDTFMRDLDPESVDRLRDAGTVRRHAAKSYLFHEGDPGRSVLIVDAGLVRIDRTTRAGRIALLDLAPTGALVGELGAIEGAPRSAAALAVTDCSVSEVQASAFLDLMARDTSIQTAVMTGLIRRLRELSTQFLQTSTLHAPARVAARLVRLVAIEQGLGHCRVDDAGRVELSLPINQEELGQWAGLTREGAVKGITTLRSLGLIETGRMQITVLNLADLERYGEG